MKIKHLLSVVAITGLIPVVFTGCGGSGGGGAASTAPRPPEPFTGQIVEVKMHGTPQGYFFEPKEIRVKRGDRLHFVCVEGGPHNISFNNQQVPTRATMFLENAGKLVGPALQVPGQTYDFDIAKDMPMGEYNFVCDPHAALGMKGKLLVGF